MMASANVELVRSGYETLARGDLAAIGDLLAPDVKWHGGDASAVDACHNRDDTLAFMRRAIEHGRVGRLVDVIEAGDHRVVVVLQPPGAAGAKPSLRANVTTVRAGRVVEMVAYDSPQAALAAAGIHDHPITGTPVSREVTTGLWLWRVHHPGWIPGAGWSAVVNSACVESGGETVLIDPLAPPPSARELWARFDARPPTVVAVLKPDHVRDVDLFVRRYGARAFGPDVFYRGDIPRTVLEPIYPGSELPGGLLALYDGRGRNETPVWLPEQKALVFADALTAPHGELRVWSTPWHEQRTLPALGALLKLPFVHVLVSHGEPVHDRSAFERALELAPWTEEGSG